MTAPAAELERRLDTFLGQWGASKDGLLAEADTFGPPLLVVATGSVVAGFGNADSDVDIWVIVDNDEVAAFPVMSYDLGCRVELGFYSATALRSAFTAVAERRLEGATTPRAWKQTWSTLSLATRVGFGYHLLSTPTGEDLLAPPPLHALHDAVGRWWTGEALRSWAAARLLVDHNPILASERYCDAVYYALEAASAAAGEGYFTSKWLTEKLARLGWEHERRMLWDALRLPSEDGRTNEDHAQQQEATLECVVGGASRDYACRFTLAPGTGTFQPGNEEIVHRWGMRGAVVGVGTVATVDALRPSLPEVLSMGGACLDDDVRCLLDADLLWLGLETADA